MLYFIINSSFWPIQIVPQLFPAFTTSFLKTYLIPSGQQPSPCRFVLTQLLVIRERFFGLIFLWYHKADKHSHSGLESLACSFRLYKRTKPGLILCGPQHRKQTAENITKEHCKYSKLKDRFPVPREFKI